MFIRRHFAAALLSALAASAIAQEGKKGAGSAGSPATQVIGIAGNYSAAGMNPDGSTYAGTVRIRQDGAAIELDWAIGNSAYSGTGTVEGRVVTVNWGSDSPVIYVIMPDGELHGTWDDGLALEKLTPG